MRQKGTWNGRHGTIVLVVDLQIGKSGSDFTLNAGVLETSFHQLVWGNPAGDFIELPSCTVQVRIGELLDGLDKWWSFEDAACVTDVKNAIVQHIIPFIERVRTHAGMRKWLTDSNVLKKRYPPPILSLVLLCDAAGDLDEACELLGKLQRKPTGAWQSTIAEISRKIGCA